MKRFILVLWLSILSISVVVASSEPDPLLKPTTKATPKGSEQWLSEAQAFMDRNPDFFKNPSEQPLEQHLDIFVECLDLYYKRRESIFVPLLEAQTGEKMPLQLMGRELILSLKTEGDERHSVLFDMTRPDIVRKELLEFFRDHDLHPSDIIAKIRAVLNRLTLMNLFKLYLQKGTANFLSYPGELTDISSMLETLSFNRNRSTEILVNHVSEGLTKIAPKLYENTEAVKGAIKLRMDYFTCGFDDSNKARMAMMFMKTNWIRYHTIYQVQESMHLLTMAAGLDAEFEKQIDFRNLMEQYNRRIANKFKPVELITAPSTPGPVTGVMRAPQWRDLIAGLFEKFHSLHDDEVMDSFLIITNSLLAVKEQFFLNFMHGKKVTNILDFLLGRSLHVQCFNGKKPTGSIISEISVTGWQGRVMEDLKDRKVDRYDLLPWLREFILQKSVEDYLCERFDEFFKLNGNPTESADELLKEWNEWNDEGKDAYKVLKDLIDESHGITNAPWKKNIQMPAKREKKPFTKMEMSCGCDFDEPLNLQLFSKRHPDQSPDTWKLLMAQYLWFRMNMVSRFALELSKGAEARKKPSIEVRHAPAGNAKLAAMKERMRKKAEVLAAAKTAPQSPSSPQKQTLEVISTGQIGQVTWTASAPAVVEAKSQDSNTRSLSEIFKEQPAVEPQPIVKATEVPTPQPSAPQPSYDVEDLPMVKDVLIPMLENPACMRLTNKALIVHIVDLIGYYAQCRRSQANALVATRGESFETKDGEFMVSIWEKKNPAKEDVNTGFVILPPTFSSKSSDLYQKLLTWSDEDSSRIPLLWMMRHDLVYEIFLLQLSEKLVKHVAWMELVTDKYFDDSITTVELATKITESTDLFKKLWACYKDLLKGFVSEKPNKGGFQITDEFRDQIECTIMLPGLDPIGTSDPETNRKYGLYMGLRDHTLKTMCSLVFPAFFNPSREMRLLMCPGQDVPVPVSIRTAAALLNAQKAEVDKVKAVAKSAMQKTVAAQKETELAKTELQQVQIVAAEQHKMLIDLEAKTKAETDDLRVQLAELKKQLEMEKAQKQEARKQIKVLKKERGATNKSLAEKVAELAEAQEQAKSAREEADNNSKKSESLTEQLRALQGKHDDLFKSQQTLQKRFEEASAAGKRESDAHQKTRGLLEAETIAHKNTIVKLQQADSQLGLARKSASQAEEKFSQERQASNEKHRQAIEVLLQDVRKAKQQARKAEEALALFKLEAVPQKQHEETIRKLEEELATSKKDLERTAEELAKAKEEAAYWLGQNNEHFGQVQQLLTKNKELSDDVKGIWGQCDELWRENKALKEAKTQATQIAPAPAQTTDSEAKIQKLKSKLQMAEETIRSLNATIKLLQKK